MIITGLRNDAIDTAEANNLVTNSDGALVTFAGITRGEHNVGALFYEAWATKAESQLLMIAEDAAQRWPLHGVLTLHRLGRVAVGETSVLCAAASAHRDDAFDACRYLIDTIKETVFVWKREEFFDRPSRWIGIPDSVASS